MQTNLCADEHRGVGDMRSLYSKLQVYPTSENGDILLIRSHIAYHSGNKAAERAAIKPSRGHSYRVAAWGTHDKGDAIVRITDYYDHRTGVTGWCDR